MALTPLRKKLNIGFGLLLLGAFSIALWPLITRPFELRAFCADLRPATTEGIIRNLAAERGFQVSPRVGNEMQIYDFQSLGKFSCVLRLDREGLVSAEFVIGD